MPAEVLSPAAVVLSWSATYLVHSTGLLAGVWLFLKIHRSAGHALREGLWKTALVGSLLTASAQSLPAPHRTFADINLAIADLGAPRPAPETPTAGGEQLA